MLHIEFQENADSKICEIADFEFNKFANENQVQCDYTPFNFVAKEDDKIIGILSGHTYYNEVHISDFIVLEAYRHKHIGSNLLKAVEEHYKDKGFAHISLSTYAFQAPAFYERHGFQIEFIRKDARNPKLTKYFFIKPYSL